jgi:RNA polymerase sigma factor for flagellar operon FliA
MKHNDADSTLDSTAQRELIDGHMHLVRRLAKQVKAATRTRQPLEELISLGTIGLIESARRYRTGGAASFKTFAYYRVRGSIYDGIAQAAPLPRSVHRRQRLRGESTHFVKSAGATLCGYAAGEPSAEERLFDAQRCAMLESAIESLPEKNRRLLRSMYLEESSLTEAADEMGVSKSWGCRVHQKTLEMLRRRLTQMAGEESLTSLC